MAYHSNPTSSNAYGPPGKFGIKDRPVSSSSPSTVKDGCPRFGGKAERDETFTASDLFCQRMGTMINKGDVQSLLHKQAETLTKFEKTNAKFGRFNDLSAARYSQLHQQLKNHTKMLVDMRRDLDSVFRRIRTLKTKLAKQYGPAFHATSASIQKLEEELGASIEEEDAASLSTLTDSRELNSDRQLRSQSEEVSNDDKEAVPLTSGDVPNQGSDLCIEEGTTVTHSADQSNESRIAQTSDISIQSNEYDTIGAVSNAQDNATVDTERTTGSVNENYFVEDCCGIVETMDISKSRESCDTLLRDEAK